MTSEEKYILGIHFLRLFPVFVFNDSESDVLSKLLLLCMLKGGNQKALAGELYQDHLSVFAAVILAPATRGCRATPHVLQRREAFLFSSGEF